MKKYLPLIIVFILFISGLGASAELRGESEKFMTEKIAFSELNIIDNKNYVSIELPEATSDCWIKDKPKIPVVTRVFTYPFGTKINNVQVQLSDIEEIKLSKPITPSPELYVDSMCVSNEIIQSDKIYTYSNIDIYPENDFTYDAAAGLEGEEHVIYLSVNVNPVKYNPSENTVYYAKNAEIDISYKLPTEPFTFPDVYDFLIITAPQFESALQRLVNHKNGLNPPVNTTMVTLDDIPSGVGVDIQEDIKFFIKDAIETLGITYVLLVGAGVEGEEIFPVRQAWIKSTPYEDFFPSDLYFADIYNDTMGFSDWDYDEDGKFAEYPIDKPDIDVLPDVYLSKIPCNDVGEVNTFIDKVIYYKKHNKMTKRILQGGGDSFTSDYINEGEYANTQVMEKLPLYATTQLWASTETLTKQNIADGFKSNVDFFDFCGHGSWASIASHPPRDEEKWVPEKTLISPYDGFLYYDFDVYLINNGKKFPVCVFKSCSGSKYSDNPDCIGWKTVSKNGGGGIASFGASGISFGATGTDIVAQTTGWMEVKSFEKLVSVKILGQIWGESINDYYNTFLTGLDKEDWKTLLEWTLMGDPTLAIQDGDDPGGRFVSNQNFLSRILDFFPILQIVVKSLQLL